MRRVYELPPSMVDAITVALRKHRVLSMSKIVEVFGVSERAVRRCLVGLPCVHFMEDDTGNTKGKFIYRADDAGVKTSTDMATAFDEKPAAKAEQAVRVEPKYGKDKK